MKRLSQTLLWCRWCKNWRVLPASVRDTLLLGLALLLASETVVALLWWRFRTMREEVADSVATFLALPPELTEHLGQVVSVPADVFGIEVAQLIVKVNGLLFGSFLAADVAAIVLNAGIARLTGDKQVPAADRSRFYEKRIRTPLLGFGAAALAVVFAAAAVANQGASLSMPDLLPIFLFLLFGFAASGLTLTILVAGRHVVKNPDARKEFSVYTNDPDLRLRIYADFVLILCVLWFFIGVTIPLVLGEGQQLPKRLYEGSQTRLEEIGATELHYAIVEFARSEAFRAPPPDDKVAMAQLAARVAYAKEAVAMILNFHEEFRAIEEWDWWQHSLSSSAMTSINAQLTAFLAVIFGFLLIFTAFMPWMVSAYAEGNLYRHFRRLWRPLVAAAPPIAIAFMLDRLGITTDRLWLWLAVMPLVAVADQVLSIPRRADTRLVFVVERGTRYHLRKDCLTLNLTADVRVQPTTQGEARRMGLEVCGVCRSPRVAP